MSSTLGLIRQRLGVELVVRDAEQNANLEIQKNRPKTECALLVEVGVVVADALD